MWCGGVKNTLTIKKSTLFALTFSWREKCALKKHHHRHHQHVYIALKLWNVLSAIVVCRSCGDGSPVETFFSLSLRFYSPHSIDHTRKKYQNFSRNHKRARTHRDKSVCLKTTHKTRSFNVISAISICFALNILDLSCRVGWQRRWCTIPYE